MQHKWNKKNSCPLLRKKKNGTKLFHHSESFTKSHRTCNHSSLAPSQTLDLVMLQNYCLIKAMYYNRHIKKSVSFSGSLWFGESRLPVFSSQSLFDQKMMASKRISTQEVGYFHSKTYKKHHHIVFMFNYEVLGLEVD